MPLSPATLPDVDMPMPELKDDGLSEDAGTDEIPEQPELRRGFILDEPDPKKVAEHIHEEIEAQEPQMSRNRAVWKRSAWWREGKRFVRLEKKENQSVWEAKLPPGMGNAPPVPNKTDRLCRRTVNVIMVDEPYPECEPGDDSNEAKDAAEFATRYLTVRGSPRELNFALLCRTALGKAMTYASSFAEVRMDVTAGGHRPREITAHPEAQTMDDALIDPMTGGPAAEDALQKRYIRPDQQTLTDDPSEADLQWLPNHRVRMLTGKNLLFLPAQATHIRSAEGVLIIDHTTLGDLRKTFEAEMDELSEDELNDLCQWKPAKYKEILPPHSPDIKDQKFDDESGKTKWKDSQIVWTVTVYYRRCAEYPKGCYAVIAGKELVLYREQWTAMMPQPPAEDGSEKPDLETVLEIPVAQCRCLDDDNYDNPYGIGMAEHLGPADEIRASSLGYQLEYMFRFGNPIPMLPMGTIVQPKQMMLRDGNPIYFNPQGQPVWEDVPALPATIPLLRDEMGVEMNDESGLQQTGQGIESGDINSGVQARTVVQEALKAISNLKSNLEYFYIDLCSIILEQSRAFSTVPTLLSYVSKDGEYKAKEWSQTSFRNTKVVSIRRGSFTMHTLTAKQELANQAFDRQVIDKEEYSELIAGGVSPILGYNDSPSLMRVRRQLDAFDDGPPDGWMEAMQAHSQALQMQQMAAMQAEAMAAATGMLQPPPIAEIPPPPPGPFADRVPSDYEPSVAKVRHRQLRRMMESSKYQVFPEPWRQELEREYMEMKNAAGIMTVPEVQQAQVQEKQRAAEQNAMAQAMGAPIQEPGEAPQEPVPPPPPPMPGMTPAGA